MTKAPQADVNAGPAAGALNATLTQALALMNGGQRAQAGVICQAILADIPDQPDALAMMGAIAGMENNPAAGVDLMRRAISRKPGVASWYGHLMSMCFSLGQWDDAVAAGLEAVRIDPNSAVFLTSLAAIYSTMGDHARALPCLLRALLLSPDHAETHLCLGESLLAQGDYGPGWAEYEWRYKRAATQGVLPAMITPAWNGMRIPSGVLLLVEDQDVDDVIQFARYIPMAAERVGQVIVACDAGLASLLETVPGVAQYCRRWEDVPPHTVYCRLSSLPYLLNTGGDLNPGATPYIQSDPARTETWRERLAGTGADGTKRIGLAWRGRHSLPLESLVPLTSSGTATFVSLQRAATAEEQAVMAQCPGMIDHSADMADFGDIAAVMESLDLIITADTAIGHLAGAMGKPVWMLLAKPADWRWMLNQDDTPWYPTMRLFKQAAPGDWESVLSPVNAALSDLLNQAAQAEEPKPRRKAAPRKAAPRKTEARTKAAPEA